MLAAALVVANPVCHVSRLSEVI